MDNINQGRSTSHGADIRESTADTSTGAGESATSSSEDATVSLMEVGATAHSMDVNFRASGSQDGLLTSSRESLLQSLRGIDSNELMCVVASYSLLLSQREVPDMFFLLASQPASRLERALAAMRGIIPTSPDSELATAIEASFNMPFINRSVSTSVKTVFDSQRPDEAQISAIHNFIDLNLTHLKDGMVIPLALNSKNEEKPGSVMINMPHGEDFISCFEFNKEEKTEWCLLFIKKNENEKENSFSYFLITQETATGCFGSRHPTLGRLIENGDIIRGAAVLELLAKKK